MATHAFSRDRSRIEMPDLLESKRFDLTTFYSILLLTAAGFMAIYSATYAANMNDRFGQQLLFAAGGIGVMIIVALLPARWFSVMAYPFYLVCLLLLVYVAFAGKLVYGQRSWIALGGT